MESCVAVPETEVIFTVTNVNVVKLRYVWLIKNFSFCQKVLKSPPFCATTLDKFQWELSSCWERSDYLSLYIKLLSESTIDIKVSFSILNSEGDVSGTSELQKFTASSGKNYGFQCFMKKERLEDMANGYLPDDSLTIVCDIAMVDGSIQSEQSNLTETKTTQTLSADLSKLLKDGTFSDVTIIVKGIKFLTHKAILASRSVVFAAMFDHDLLEKKTNTVEITDLDADVVEEMLDFMYTGASKKMDKIAGDLLAAADKYALHDLKQLCTAKLADHINADTAVQTLIIADIWHADELKVQAMNYIILNASQILKTEYWKVLKNEHPSLGTELYERSMNPPASLMYSKITKSEKI